jgi:hypothetical protein
MFTAVTDLELLQLVVLLKLLRFAMTLEFVVLHKVLMLMK